jgi:hypothetical protein
MRSTDTRSSTGAEGGFWSQGGRVLSAVFLLATVVVASVTWLTEDDEPVPEARGKSPLSVPVTGEERPAGCRTDDKDQRAPSDTPEAIEWAKVNGSEVPASASAGPLRSDGPVRWCFAHTRLGAVLAAHGIPAQMSGKDWRTVTEDQVVPGRRRELFVAQRSTVQDVAPGSTTTASYAGFAVSSYSDRVARIRLLLRNASDGYSATTVEVRWSGGDWKVAPSRTGDLYSRPETVSTKTGFTLWRT